MPTEELTPERAEHIKKHTTLGIIFLTIFVNMVGFGIVIPVLPEYAKNAPFKMSPESLGWLVGVFSLVQLFTAPIFGKISDRVGRKRVLIVSIIGTAIGYFVTGAAFAPWMLFLGRIIDGASGGNIATAQACIADVTKPEDRSKAMGFIGAAFGLGFMLGPAIGGLLSHFFSPAAPFYFAGVLSIVNVVLVVMKLPETLPPEKRDHPTQPAPLSEVFADGRASFVSFTLIASLLSTIGFAFVHLLFSLFCADHLGYSRAQMSYAFAFVGLMGVLVQGGLLRRLLKRPIEKQLAFTGCIILAFSLWWLPRTYGTGQFLAACALMALGNGLSVPIFSGMVSRYVHGRAQGRALALNTAAGSLGRYLGPLLASLPLPVTLAHMQRPLLGADLALVNQGYQTAFTWAATFMIAAAVFTLLLKAPKPVAE